MVGADLHAVESIRKDIDFTQLYVLSVVQTASKCLRVRCWRTKTKAEKASKLYTEMNNQNTGCDK